MTRARASPHALESDSFDLKRALLLEIQAAEAALGGPVPERAIHAGRVKLKRVRAIARLAIDVAPWTSRRINRMAQEIMAALSTRRDLDALIACAKLLSKGAKRRARRGFLRFIEALEIERGAIAPPDLTAVVGGVRALNGLARALPHLDADDVRIGLSRLLAKARRGFRRAKKSDSSEVRHRWRKREKDALFALQILDGYNSADRPERTEKLAKLTDTLGKERDAQMVLERLGSNPQLIAGGQTRRATKKALRTAVRALQRKAGMQAGKLYRNV